MMNVLIRDIGTNADLTIVQKTSGTWVVLVYGARTAVLRVVRFGTKRLGLLARRLRS
jgi:hypothetical protein